MTTDEFWKIIEDARTKNDSCEAIAKTVQQKLESLSLDEVIGFERERQLRMAESYRWDLWAVAYIINGGCSDDGFHYFCGWLIAKGRSYFEAAMKDCRRAADDAAADECECEDMNYVATSAYKAKTGSYPPDDDPRLDVPFPKEPVGQNWEEDSLEALYPELWERFS